VLRLILSDLQEKEQQITSSNPHTYVTARDDIIREQGSQTQIVRGQNE